MDGIFDDEKDITGYIITSFPCDEKYQYGWFGAIGDCMDSPKSPMRIKDGDKLLIHKIPITQIEIMRNVGKVISFVIGGQGYHKHLCFADLISNILHVTMYNPYQKFYIPIAKIDELFVVDDVKSPEEFSKLRRVASNSYKQIST